MTHLSVRAAFAILALACASHAYAHELWFEPSGDAMVLFYGDYGVNMHERSPGGNDRWGVLTATHVTPNGDKPVALTKQSDRFTGVPRVAKGESLIAYDDYYRIFEETKDGKVVRSRWSPATRWVPDFGARAPKLKLDIVPTGFVSGDEVEFQVFYQGEPLPDVVLHVWNPAGWVNDTSTDGDGKARVVLPWKGMYGAVVLRYVDETPGVRNSEPDKQNPLLAHPSETGRESYDRWSHTTLLSFYKETGLPELPRHKETLPASMLAAPAKH